jgi:hypothetical protein
MVGGGCQPRGAPMPGGGDEEPTAQGVGRDGKALMVIDDAVSATGAIDAFREYPKLLSWILLHAARVPALPGIVIAEWNTRVAREVQQVTSRWGSQSLLLRSDSILESGLSPRGGFLVDVDDAEEATRALLDQGRLVFLLEPASPFDDLYSVNLEPDANWREWLLEIVGAGFDASDLKRGDVTPNETVRLLTGSRGVFIESREIADPAILRAARGIRLLKVALMLRCAPSELERLLRLRGETLLLDEPSYRPMPASMIEASIEAALRLRPMLARHKLSDQRVTLSLSFLTRDARLVFWDIVWPAAKYIRGHPERLGRVD